MYPWWRGRCQSCNQVPATHVQRRRGACQPRERHSKFLSYLIGARYFHLRWCGRCQCCYQVPAGYLPQRSEFQEGLTNYSVLWSRHSSVGMATRYTLDGPGFESCRRQEFFSSLMPSRPSVWDSHPPSQWVLGRGMNLTTGPPSGVQVKNH